MHSANLSRQKTRCKADKFAREYHAVQMRQRVHRYVGYQGFNKHRQGRLGNRQIHGRNLITKNEKASYRTILRSSSES